MNTHVPIFIDSGAFSAWTQKKPIDIDSYIAFLHEVLKKDKRMVYANLDVIGDGKASYQNWKEMRSQGLNPLAVYHINTDIKWLKKYLDRTAYVGIGAMARTPDSKRRMALDRIWGEFLTDSNGMPTIHVHGFGLASFELMGRYPWYSIDSTSWMIPGIYGKIYVPSRLNGEWRYDMKFVMGCSPDTSLRCWKGNHFENVGPLQRKNLMDYLKETGFKYGKSKVVDGEEEIVVPGISNDRDIRCFITALLFSRYVQTLKWPRAFTRRGGLFKQVDQRKAKAGISSNTLLYLGATGFPIEEKIRTRPEDFPGFGILVSFFDMGNETDRQRLEKAIKENR